MKMTQGESEYFLNDVKCKRYGIIGNSELLNHAIEVADIFDKFFISRKEFNISSRRYTHFVK